MKYRDRKENNFIYLIAFLFPFAIMMVISVACEAAPFGDNSYMIIDALHQYLPFLSEYQGKLQQGESLFYTWNGGMGMNFLSLWTYYLASPLNLALALGKQTWIPAIANLLIILKLCLASVSFTFYRIHTPVYGDDARNRIYIRRRKEDYSILAGALAYCFSSYMIGYSWNIMWLDPIALFPLIMYGMNRLLVKKDGRLYTAALFLALFCNYYISFMICLYLVLWFFLYSHGSFRRFLENGVGFALHSLLAAAMSGVTLLPAYLGLKNTAAVNETAPGWEWYGKWKELLAAHMMLVEPVTNQPEDSAANLYIGILTLYLALLYLWDKQIPLKTRIKKLALAAFLAVSFQNGLLNYVWHGFHNQYGIPNRFAFLYVFTLITMAMEVMGHIRSMPVTAMIFTSLLVMGGALLLYRYGAENLTLQGCIATCMVMAVYLLLLLTFRLGLWRRRYWKYALALAAGLELSISGIWGFMTIGQVNISKFYNDTQIMAHIRERYPVDGRIELADSTVIDEISWHRLPGVTLFGSTAQGSVTSYMGKMGVYTGANEYVYRGSTPFTDSLWGVQYLLVRPGDENRNHMEYRTTAANVDIYENPYALPLGFCVEKDREENICDDGNPFHYQNRWADEELFRDIPLGKGMIIDGKYCYALKADRDMELYFYFWDNHIDTIRIESDKREYRNGEYRNQCIYVGRVSKGEIIRAELTPEEGREPGMPDQALAAEYDAGALEEFYAKTSGEPLKIETRTGSRVQGRVTAEGDKILLTSIPYDRGWTVRVDGKKVETASFAGVFLSLPVSAGEHEITFSYLPPGFLPGLVLSAGGWLLFWFAWRKASIKCHFFHKIDT